MGHHPCCCNCTFFYGEVLSDPLTDDWILFGNVYRNSSGMLSGGAGVMLSTDTTSPSGTAEAIADIITELGSDQGAGSYSGWTGQLDGDTTPTPTFFDDGVGYETTSGVSNVGSVMYRDFVATGGDTLYFKWEFATTEKTVGSAPPADKVDFAFVAVQRQGDASPTVHRLSDTSDEHLTSTGPTLDGSASASTSSFKSHWITLPGSGSGTYRVSFGCINVDDDVDVSALAVKQICLASCCACTRTCTSCLNDLAPCEWEITISGLPEYSYFGGPSCHLWNDYYITTWNSGCAWWFGVGSQVLQLFYDSGANNYYITVGPGTSWGFRKDYGSTKPDCLSFVDEDIPWNSGYCATSPDPICTITAILE